MEGREVRDNPGRKVRLYDGKSKVSAMGSEREDRFTVTGLGTKIVLGTGQCL